MAPLPIETLWGKVVKGWVIEKLAPLEQRHVWNFRRTSFWPLGVRSYVTLIAIYIMLIAIYIVNNKT